MSGVTVRAFLASLSTADVEALETFRPLAHQQVVITGALAEHVLREHLTASLYTWGAVIESTVRPSTDVLLAVEPERMTQKRKDAARYGVTVLDEYGFVRWLSDALARAHEDGARLAAHTAPAPPPEWFADTDEYEDTITPLSDYGA